MSCVPQKSYPGAMRAMVAGGGTEGRQTPTWGMRLAVRRRLGLPLATAAAAAEKRSRHGLVFDEYGDTAQNDADEGHQTRHYLLLNALFDAMRSVYGGVVQREPSEYKAYSDTRPDLVGVGLGAGGSTLVGDVKLWSDLNSHSQPTDGGCRGGAVAFGSLQPKADLVVHGRRERGVPSDGTFNARTGAGYVAPAAGQYTRAAEEHGCDVKALLFSVFGGWSPVVVGLFQQCADARQNKLRKDEYDVTTWSARTWLSFKTQKVSVALHRAVALELATALGRGRSAQRRC